MPDTAQPSFPQTLFYTRQPSLPNSEPLDKPFDYAKGGRASGGVNNAEYHFSSGVFAARWPAGALKADPRPAVRGLQDKAALAGGPVASPQLGPETKVARAGVSDTEGVRSQNHHSAKEKKVKGGVWMWPRVKEALETIADQSGLSFSETAATGLEIYVRAKIHDQEEELFEPRMRAMIRQEIRASDNRHIIFEMRNAIAAEQTRVLITNLYKRQLELDGLTQEAIQKKVDRAYSLARSNVLRKTPQLKSLLDAWWNDSQDAEAESRVGEGNGVAPNGSGDIGLYPSH
jgi:hypothetical protein